MRRHEVGQPRSERRGGEALCGQSAGSDQSPAVVGIPQIWRWASTGGWLCRVRLFCSRAEEKLALDLAGVVRLVQHGSEISAVGGYRSHRQSRGSSYWRMGASAPRSGRTWFVSTRNSCPPPSLLPRPKRVSPQGVVFRLSTKLPISSPMTVTRYSWPVSISITARACPAGVAAEKSPKPVVVSTVKLK